jgi:periplasmic protein TonB
METNVFDKEWVELVFEGRNKNYGAYVIRKNQGNNTVWGLVITLAMGGAAIIVPQLVQAFSNPVPVEERYIGGEVVLDDNIEVKEKIEPIVVETPPAAPVETIKDLPFVVVPNDEVDEIIPSNEDKDKTKTGNVTTVGEPSDGDGILIEETFGGGGNEPDIIEKEIELPPILIAEQMPEFIGGEEEMMKYLGSHIVYPETEKENGIAGTVYLQFVIERDGSISNVNTLRGVRGGVGLQNEATRIVQAMPKWLPGKQNGKTVRVQFNLPVNFRLRQ